MHWMEVWVFDLLRNLSSQVSRQLLPGCFSFTNLVPIFITLFYSARIHSQDLCAKFVLVHISCLLKNQAMTQVLRPRF